MFFFGKSLTDHDSQGPPKKLAPCLAEPHLTDQRYNLSLENKQKLNINITSFFLDTLASPNEKTRHDTGGPITKTINHFSLNPNHRRSVEKTWKTMISYLEKGVKYTGNNKTKKNGRPYLISSSHEINLIANSMERRLGLRYTTLLINFHRHTKGDNAVCRSTVNLAYKRLQPRIKKIQKIQQGTKNEGKWKEARYRQVKQ